MENSFSTCLSQKCQANDLDKMFQRDNLEYLVMVFPIKGNKHRTGFFDIKSVVQLQQKIYSEYGNESTCDEFEYCFIDQMREMEGCFTATIISNGKGSLVIEYLTNTIDNRDITSNTKCERVPHKIIFIDFELVECDGFEILKILFDDIKKCLWLKGYYELSYATVQGKKDVYFSYYSDEGIYMNYFDCNRMYTYESRNRCILQFLKEIGYLY